MKKKKRNNSFLIWKLMILTMFYFQLSSAQDNNWSAPVEADKLENPVANDAKAIAKGKKIYYQICAVCHGRTGVGNGPNAKTLKIKPADHTNPKFHEQSDGALYYKISKGRDPMPSYNEVFSKTQRWQLVAYIRTLKIDDQ